MATRLPRWTRLLVLPMLVGALALMHGLDAHAADPHRSEQAASASVVDEHPHHESLPDEHSHCIDCLATHVMAACVAIVAAAGGLALVRGPTTRGSAVTCAARVAGRVRDLVELARPPDPAWIRLSVMRC
jgi:hypothetical protein